MNITAPWMIKEESTIKHYSSHNLTQTTFTFFNNQYDAFSTNPYQHELVGGRKQKCNIVEPIGKQSTDFPEQNGITMEEYLDVILKKVNRIDFPITLDPTTASFDDVAIHAILRQRLKKTTVAKRIASARFMESHSTAPVDFRNPHYENFIRHMDYREQVENAGYGALGREWDTMKTFLRAYGISISDWPYRAPSRPYYTAKFIPFPDQINEILHLTYSDDSYENALIQYLLTHNFVIGWRIPSEPAILKLPDVMIDDQDRGYIKITEPKKHDSTRIVTPTEIMTSKRRKSMKNWIDHWRPKVVNQYSGEYVYLLPDGRPFAKDSLRMYLNRNAGPLIKTVFPKYHNYIARDFCAIARLIRTKIQSKSFDEFEVKEWLGHTKIQTTMCYVKDANHYYKMAPYDWINRVLKADCKTGGENAEIQKHEKIGSFDPFSSEKSKRTWWQSNLLFLLLLLRMHNINFMHYIYAQYL